ncbi:MAG: SUMF1/EgtB/PvdO family nonheme iron enzyme, partial [Anaerolineae bacterium]|nr:SUMF1/EgtB/PvdO family nonheme iron enzyme [Anaerolineae bacterium]
MMVHRTMSRYRFMFGASLVVLLAIPLVIAGATPGSSPPDLPMQRIPPGEIDLSDGATVFVPEFFIGVYEVTNAVYAQCVEAGTCEPPRETALPDGMPYYGDAAYADFPVLSIPYEQATAFCAWAGL